MLEHNAHYVKINLYMCICLCMTTFNMYKGVYKYVLESLTEYTGMKISYIRKKSGLD